MNILIAIGFVLLYAICKAITDIRRDQPASNWLYHALSGPWGRRFYEGGAVNGYTQRMPFSSDMWHLADASKLYLLIGALLLNLELAWWGYLVLAVVLLAIAGRLFALLYSYLLPDWKQNKLWTWLVNSFLFWRGENN
jgi:hypothetical protein